MPILSADIYISESCQLPPLRPLTIIFFVSARIATAEWRTDPAGQRMITGNAGEVRRKHTGRPNPEPARERLDGLSLAIKPAAGNSPDRTVPPSTFLAKSFLCECAFTRGPGPGPGR